MTVQWLPMLMGMIALIAIILKIRPQTKPNNQAFVVSAANQAPNNGLITVSGVTVEQLRVIADALEKQKAAK